MFYQFGRLFGWTPDEIRHLTIQEVEHYVYQTKRDIDITPLAEQTLEAIRRALFGFFGIKDNEEDETDKLVGKAPAVPKDELEKWYAAGMPSPPPWKRG